MNSDRPDADPNRPPFRSPMLNEVPKKFIRGFLKKFIRGFLKNFIKGFLKFCF